MESQVSGLAEALGLPTVRKRSQRKYPWRLLSAGFSWNALKHLTPNSDPLAPPWPDVLITCGRGSVPLALAIRARSKGKTFCVHIQDPHVNPARFDMVVAPRHDRLKGSSVLQTDVALHHLTEQKLSEARIHYEPLFRHMDPPFVTVLIGGSGSHYQMTKPVVAALIQDLEKLLSASKGSLLITPSRRTGEENVALMRAHFKASRRVFIANLAEDNPYLGLLALADTLCVTEDSVSMVSEASFTGKPVYILRLPGHKRKKTHYFIEHLRQQNIVRYFEGKVEEWSYPPPHDTKRVADLIRQKLQERTHNTAV